MLNALPVLSALRSRLEEAQIDWVVEDRSAELLAQRADLDGVIEYPRRALSAALGPWPRPWGLGKAARGFLSRLRATRYDLVLDLQGNLKSGAVARAARAAARFGFDRETSREANHLFSNRRAAPPAGARHRVEQGLALASAALGQRLDYVPPGFPVSAEVRGQAEQALQRAGLPSRGFVVLHPGTSAFGAFKRWPPERFGALAGRLHSDGHVVCETHGPDEQALAERVVAAPGGTRAVPLMPPGLGALAEVLRRARLFVGADTGPLHLAALVGTPVIGLFGPKDPRIYGPYGLRADGSPGVLAVLTQDDVACRPCGLRVCADPLCLRTLDPARVHAAATPLVAAAS